MSQVWAYLSVAALMFTGLLLIFIILLQRGRGGGLAGAFGGAGGQSALGTKAGDVFTKITVGLAVFWVLLACLSIYALRAGTEFQFGADADNTPTVTSDGEPGGSPVPPDAPANGTIVPGGSETDAPGSDSSNNEESSTDNEATPGPDLTPPADDAADADSAEAATEEPAAPANP